MKMFESVSSEVQVISDSRSRHETTASLKRILEMTLPHKELTSVSRDISKYLTSIDSDARTMRRGQVVKKLKRHILPKIESLSAELSSRVPVNVIKTFERVIITASIARRQVLVISPDLLFSTAEKESGEYLRNADDIKLFRKIIYAPYNHARLGLDLIASICTVIEDPLRREVWLGKLKPVLFADEAVKRVYDIALNHPEWSYKEIVTSNTLRADDYSDKFFPRGMSTRVTTGQFGDAKKFADINQVRRGVQRLVESRKNLKALSEISPVVAKKHSKTYTDASWTFLANMGDGLRPSMQLARDKDITTSQKSLRDALGVKFGKKIPTVFDESSTFTLTMLPLEAFVSGSPKFRDPEVMERYGIKLFKEQVGSKKSDASFFYADQPVLFFHRELLIDHMLEELTETAKAALSDFDIQTKQTRAKIKEGEAEIRELERDRLEATPKAARVIDRQIGQLMDSVKSLGESQITVKTQRAAAKKELDRRIKHYAKNRNEVLDTALRFVLETINERSATEYTLVSSVYNPNPKAPVSSMAWLMPTPQYNALEGSLGNFSVTKWNLPWAAK